MTTYRFPVVIEKDKDGYFAFSPDNNRIAIHKAKHTKKEDKQKKKTSKMPSPCTSKTEWKTVKRFCKQNRIA